MTNKFVKGAFAIAATASVALLAGCPSGQAPGGTGTPSAAPSGAASVAPSAPASPASPGATAAPTALPSTSDVSDRATVKGVIEDDQDQRLDGVTVTATILDGGQSTFSNGAKELTVTSALGSYVLNGCPTGVTLKIVAKKSGFTTRTQTYVPLANKQGDPSANQVNFGEDNNIGNDIYQLSDKPEVTSMTPARAATGVAMDSSLVLTFSEAVDKTSAQDNFRVGLSDDADLVLSTGDTVDAAYTEGDDDGTNAALTAGDFFYNKTHLTFTWNSDRTQVTVAPKSGYQWPSDSDSDLVPSWAIYFDGAIEDDANNQRTNEIFRLTETSAGKFGSYFKVAKDDVDPEVESVTALNASGGAGDRILVKFSETMAIFPNGGAVDATSIPGSDKAGYILTTPATGVTYFDYIAASTNDPTTDFDVDGDNNGTPGETDENEMYFDPNDSTKSTVVLEFIADTFAVGDRVAVDVSTTATDPAGNAIPSDKDEEEATAS